jgi:DNA-binding MarR family transcriptional regulator
METMTYGFRTTPKPRTNPLGPGSGLPVHALRDACEQLVYASLRVTRFEANEEGLSIPQSFLLLNLAKLGPVPIRQLVVSSGNSPATVGGILDGLEAVGAVRREHGVEDRRHVLVSLTPEGQRIAARLEARRAERWAPLELKVREEDAAAATRILMAVSAEFSAWKKDGPAAARGPRPRIPKDRASLEDPL